MSGIEVYSSGFCPYCVMATRLLDKKGETYTVYRVDTDPDKRVEMEQRSQRRTVPQIFINGVHVGGYTDLEALERNQELDSLLAGGAAPC